MNSATQDLLNELTNLAAAYADDTIGADFTIHDFRARAEDLLEAFLAQRDRTILALPTGPRDLGQEIRDLIRPKTWAERADLGLGYGYSELDMTKIILQQVLNVSYSENLGPAATYALMTLTLTEANKELWREKLQQWKLRVDSPIMYYSKPEDPAKS